MGDSFGLDDSFITGACIFTDFTDGSFFVEELDYLFALIFLNELFFTFT